MRKIGLIAVLLLMVLVVLAGCGDNNQASQTTTDSQTTAQKTGSTATDGDGVSDQPTEEAQPQDVTEATSDENPDSLTDTGGDPEGEVEESDPLEEGQKAEKQAMLQLQNGPFLGKLVEKIDLPRPIMVMVENSPAARPQKGLDQASIIYEYLVEGGITRFLALFYETFPTEVGPVRSTRPYFIHTALEYKALLLHVGGSPEAFHLLETSGVDHVDQISHDMYFLRNNSRRAPHNVYTGKNMIQSLLDEQPAKEIVESRFPYQIIGLVNQARVEEAYDIKIRYWGGYTVGYKFNESEGEYLRFIDGVPHLLEGGKKLYADNIFVQYVDTNIKDDEGRLDMQTTGSGKAILFKDGYVYQGSWIKDDGGETFYLDELGNEWQINPGQTWIQVVPLSVKVEY